MFAQMVRNFSRYSINMEVREFGFKLNESISRFYADNFYDNPLYKDELKLSKGDLETVFKLFLDLLGNFGGNRIFGIAVNGEIISAAVFLAPNWKPPVLKSLGMQLKLIAGLGIKKGLPLVSSMYGTSTFELDDAWHLLLLATSGDHRRKGYATKILRYFTGNFLNKEGSDIIYLRVLKNSYAKNFYEKLGFEIYKAHRISDKDKFECMYLSA